MYQELPKLAAKPLTLLPFQFHAFILSKMLTKIFKEQIVEGDCDFLRARWLKLNIADLDIEYFFSLGSRGEVKVQKSADESVSIRGNLNEFILLAARKEDPDTLFFQRKLVIEGDTELGLEVKNLIDSADLNRLSKELRFMIAGAGEWVTIAREN